MICAESIGDLDLLVATESAGVDSNSPVEKIGADFSFDPTFLVSVLGQPPAIAGLDHPAGDRDDDRISRNLERKVVDAFGLADLGAHPTATGHVRVRIDVVGEGAGERLAGAAGNPAFGDFGLSVLRVHREGRDVGAHGIGQADGEGIASLGARPGRVHSELDLDHVPGVVGRRLIVAGQVLNRDSGDHLDFVRTRRGRHGNERTEAQRERTDESEDPGQFPAGPNR